MNRLGLGSGRFGLNLSSLIWGCRAKWMDLIVSCLSKLGCQWLHQNTNRHNKIPAYLCTSSASLAGWSTSRNIPY